MRPTEVSPDDTLLTLFSQISPLIDVPDRLIHEDNLEVISCDGRLPSKSRVIVVNGDIPFVDSRPTPNPQLPAVVATADGYREAWIHEPETLCDPFAGANERHTTRWKGKLNDFDPLLTEPSEFDNPENKAWVVFGPNEACYFSK